MHAMSGVNRAFAVGLLLSAIPAAWAQESQPVAVAGDLVLKTQPTDTVIPLTGNLVLQADGSIEATPTDTSVCQATNSCEGVSVTVSEFEFSNGATSIQVEEGDSVVLSWRALGATNCRATGSYSPWAGKGLVGISSGDVSTTVRTVNTSVGDFANTPLSLGLRCFNGTIEDTSTVTVNLTEYQPPEPPSPTSCVGREPPVGWTQSYGGSFAEWTDVYGWYNGFLDSVGLAGAVFTNYSASKQYASIRFNTNGMTTTAAGELPANTINTVRRPPVVMAISKCPGDFHDPQVTGCLAKPSAFALFRWRGPNSSFATNCVLEPNTTYFLNIAPTSSAVGTDPDDFVPIAECATEPCGVLIAPRSR